MSGISRRNWIGLWVVIACAWVCARPGCVWAQGVQGLAPRQTVVFEVTQTTTFGSSVFVVGDLPELGSGSTVNAIKLSPAAYPVWRVSLSLPVGRTVNYRYIVRADGPGQQTSAPTWTSGNLSLTVPDQARATQSKSVWVTTGLDRPVLWWRPASPTSGGAFTARPMEMFGPAVAGRSGETQWFAWGFHVGGEAFDFYFTNAAGTQRVPASGFHSTNLDGVFVQDGQLYTYVPAAVVGAARRGYDPANVPTLFSPQLNQTRGYRVYLPRGYDQHLTRRYPVLYFHDGQNVFDQGPFGSWNAGSTLGALQASGQMQEVIAVGLDNNGSTRIADYSPPGENAGRGDLYLGYVLNTVKPVIDAAYRTRPEPEHTGVMGSSMGGVISAYFGYDAGARFSKIGCLSTAWWIVPNLTNSVKTQSARPGLRIYMDVGDSGTSNDGYWDSVGVRDSWAGGSGARYPLDGSLRFVVGFGQSHNEAAWSARLPGALTYLFPSQAEANTLLRTLFNPTWDRDADGQVTIDDLYAQAANPGDLNLDGVTDGVDTVLLEGFLRRNEARGMSGR